MELKIIIFSLRCWFLCMTSLAVMSSTLKTSVKFEVLLLNSGYAPAHFRQILSQKFKSFKQVTPANRNNSGGKIITFYLGKQSCSVTKAKL